MPFSPLHGQFCQIHHIRHFRQKPWQNFVKFAIFATVCISSKLICICENISHNSVQFAGFTKFAIFATFAKSFDKILSNLPFLPLHGQFCQIHHIHRFRQKPWQNFVKFAIFATACISGHKWRDISDSVSLISLPNHIEWPPLKTEIF